MAAGSITDFYYDAMHQLRRQNFKQGESIMNIYKEFAKVYDIFMAEVPYNTWADYIDEVLKQNKRDSKLILELGCGTGSITTLMKEKGYDMIGVDISEDMLMIAKDKDENILYLNQDMREFELFGTVDACICLCDSLNYILEEKEILQIFKLVNNYLNPDGLFIFDINTKHKFQNILGDNSYCQAEENSAYIWENYYDEDAEINEYYTNIFVKEKNNLYQRHEEFHYQRAYTEEVLKDLITQSGMELLQIYEGFTFNTPTPASERLVFITKEKGK